MLSSAKSHYQVTSIILEQGLEISEVLKEDLERLVFEV